jgi:hypothetical protein
VCYSCKHISGIIPPGTAKFPHYVAGPDPGAGDSLLALFRRPAKHVERPPGRLLESDRTSLHGQATWLQQQHTNRETQPIHHRLILTRLRALGAVVFPVDFKTVKRSARASGLQLIKQYWTLKRHTVSYVLAEMITQSSHETLTRRCATRAAVHKHIKLRTSTASRTTEQSDLADVRSLPLQCLPAPHT